MNSLLTNKQELKNLLRRLKKGLSDVADIFIESTEFKSQKIEIDVKDDGQSFTVKTDLIQQAIKQLHEKIIEECEISWNLNYCMPIILIHKPDLEQIEIVSSCRDQNFSKYMKDLDKIIDEFLVKTYKIYIGNIFLANCNRYAK